MNSAHLKGFEAIQGFLQPLAVNFENLTNPSSLPILAQL